jgi:Lrp/AsnC family transcriptional regulator for asnA, asnC and gidA
MQPDDFDWKLISILRNGHVNNSEVAKELGVSEGKVRQRLKKLKDSDILRVRGEINPEALEGQQLAIVAINVTESRLLDQKAKEVSSLEHVLHVMIVSGQFDILAHVLVDSNKGLVNFLTERLSEIQGITATQSFIVLKSTNLYV